MRTLIVFLMLSSPLMAQDSTYSPTTGTWGAKRAQDIEVKRQQAPVEILIQMVEAQQKQIDSLVNAVQKEDQQIQELRELIGKRPVKLDSVPHSNGCYQWLSDGGREPIPCPLKEKK